MVEPKSEAPFYPNELPIPKPMKILLKTDPTIVAKLQELQSKEITLVPYDNIVFEHAITDTKGAVSYIYVGRYLPAAGKQPIQVAIK